MQFDETYKGYRIKYRQTGELFTTIWPPNHGLAISEIARASIAEGRNVLRMRAHAVVEADIAKTAENKK